MLLIGSLFCFQQTKLFLSEESPSQVGLDVQDHLQAKASWLPHPIGTATDDILPPGFEGSQPPNHLHIRVSEVPVIKWRSPPRLILNLAWQVVAGEESEEVEAQNQRELRVLEAVYPRPSAIPPNPNFSVDAEDSQHNDHNVLLIPMIPIEDEDAADNPADIAGPSNMPMSSQPQLLASGIPTSQCSISNIPHTAVTNKLVAGAHLAIEHDVVAAASAAFTAINKSNEHGGLIDHDLLIKILSNPQLIEKLTSDNGSMSSAQTTAKATAPFVPLSGPPPPPPPAAPSHLHINGIEANAPSSLAATPSGPYYAQPNGVGLGITSNSRGSSAVVPMGIPAASVPSAGASQAKDVNYYKKLIQQHGGERQEAPQQFVGRYNQQIGTNKDLVNPKPRDSRPKIMKPCIYFNSSRGCRNGANCAYQHDASSQQRGSSISEAQSAKRMKMDREISS
uniref:C3H1-type domain-containing protein n=1 Tax=Rhizophora mucronata TaxID=61149 RepID=A0A2P2JM24_RHIMU